MKIVIQYSPQDLRRLVADHATSMGYAVLPENIDMPDDFVVMVDFDGTPTPPNPQPPVVAGVAVAEAKVRQVAAPLPTTKGPPSGSPEPSQEGAWTSQNTSGEDPRYVPIEPPTSTPRVPFIRELGGRNKPSKLRRGTPHFGFEEAPELPEEEEADATGLPDTSTDFLDDYLQPKAGN